MFKVGIGYDVHPFASGRKLVLGGVSLPAAKGLDGYSDADVLSHAIADALLGAAGLGDIGVHFPDSEEKWRNISGMELLKLVGEKIAKIGLRLGNIDATLVLEAPAIASFRNQMSENIARVLGAETTQISIKATTSEKLGFVGRGEGAAAMAVALLQRG